MKTHPDDIDNPMFSIVVPTYNQADYLPAALDSILTQTFDRWEAVVVNDGSRDHTADVMQTYAEKDARFNGYHQENGGVAAALNTGIRHAKGQWICWLSSDDLFEPDKLKVHLEAIQENPDTRFFHSHYYYLDNESGVKSAPELWHPIPDPALQVITFFKSPYIHGNSIAIHRSVFDEVGLFNEKSPCGQDFDMWLRISARYPSHFIDHRTCVTRWHAGQTTNLFPEACFFDSARACLEFMTRQPFETYFPVLDLTQPADIIKAVRETVKVALDQDAVMYRLGVHTALVDRMVTWIEERCPAKMQAQIRDFLKRLAENLPSLHLPGKIVEGLRRIADATTAPLWCAPDLIATARQHADQLQQQGKTNDAATVRKYLANLTDENKGAHADVNSNLEYWQQLQDDGYFSKHHCYKGNYNHGSDNDVIQEYTPLSREMTVVVIGCGYGREILHIAPHVRHVYGIDVNGGILKKAEGYLKNHRIQNFTPVLAEQWHDLIPDGIDLVYSFVVFQHLTRDLVRDYVHGMKEKLSENGRYICQFAELNDGTKDAKLEAYEPCVRWSRNDIEDLISEAGLDMHQLKTQDIGHEGLWHWAHFGRRSNQADNDILFYYAGLHNSDQPYAGSNSAMVLLARKVAALNPSAQVHLTGDRVVKSEKTGAAEIVRLPPQDQLQDFIGRYRTVVFATHIGVFDKIEKKSHQNWILHQHSWDIGPKELGRLREFDHVIALTDNQRQAVIRQGVSPEKIEILPNALSPRKFYPVESRRIPKTILFVGALVEHKGIDILINAFKEVRGIHPDATLHIYGDAAMWNETDEFERYLRSIAGDHVTYHGARANEEMPKIYSSHDVLCLPSHMESFGLVTIEAQACGCIPVVHDIGGTSATMDDGRTGFLYAPNNVATLSMRLINALDAVELNPGMRHAAVTFAHEHFDIDKVARRFMEIARLCVDIQPREEMDTGIEAGKSLRRRSVQVSELDRIIPAEIKDDAFFEDILQLAAQDDVRHILEIGSSSGEGSTAAFVRGMSTGNPSARLYCMELSHPRFEKLDSHYADNPQVTCYHASSVPLDQFPNEVDVEGFYKKTPTALNQYPLERVLGWLQQDKDYLSRSGACDHGIEKIKAEQGIDGFDLVLIDGSEFTGRAELDQVYGATIILLDDINGFKNHHNFQRLMKDPTYHLDKVNRQLRNGYAIFSRKDTPPLPVHFFTIVLNGEPFIRYHLDIFKQLEIPWHWHIIEGVADLKHDTAWSKSNGGRIRSKYHDNGLSVDGTTAYLDQIALEHSDHITLYRKPGGEFWDGKLEMVNAPFGNLPENCLLWQIDADELWQAEQINRAHRMFLEQPQRTAGMFHCHFFVGPDLVTTTMDSYSHNTAYEWIRVWRYQKGMQWRSHEPPCLMTRSGNEWVDTARQHPFSHLETEAAGLVFTHYAYALASQVRFKEDYYGYSGAVDQWRQLQSVQDLPVHLSAYFDWVTDGTLVDRVANRTIGKNIPPVNLDTIVQPDEDKSPEEREDRRNPHVVIDGVIFQLQAGRAQGISRVWTNLISEWVRQFPEARITVLQRDGFTVPVSSTAIERIPAYQLGDDDVLDGDDEMLRQICQTLDADIFISTYYTRAPGVRNMVMVHDMIPELLGFDLSQHEWLAKQRVMDTGDAFMCVSRSTRKDLVDCYPHTVNKPVAVVPNGVEACFKPAAQSEITDFTKKFHLSKPYLLLVGNRRGYKGGVELLRALSELPVKTDWSVVCVGGEPQAIPEELNLQGKLDVRLAGQLSDSELVAAYSGAQALMMPSRYEGFGLPVVEAMRCGCPVIATQTPAVEEIGADAVLLADLSRPDSIGPALRQISDPEFRARMIARGSARANHFNWNASAKRLDCFINDIMSKPSILLTAVVSTYNAAQFIKGCLEDLEVQTMADRLEIIVIDSASQEDEAAVVRDFQRQYANIKYMRTPNREKVYQAWNRGIKFALGQYVSNANTDDRHRRDAYERMVGALEDDDRIALVYADVIKTQTANQTFRQCNPAGMFRWPDWDRKTLFEKGCFIGPQPVWRKDVHRSYGYFNESYTVSADFEFWLRISQTHDFHHIPIPLGLYMERPDSIEHANSGQKAREDREIINMYRRAAAENKTIECNQILKEGALEPQDPKARAMDRPNADSKNHFGTPDANRPKKGAHMNSPETISFAISRLIECGEKEAAYWAMEKLLADFPDDARSHNIMAAMAYEQGDFPKAGFHYKQAASLAPQQVHYIKDLGDYLYVVEKDAQGAVAQYEAALTIDAKHIETLIMAGHVSISMHQYEAAKQYYRQVLEIDPHHSEVKTGLEKMQAMPSDPPPETMDADELYAAAQEKAQMGDLEAATALLAQLVAQDNENAAAHNDLGVLHYEADNLSSAQKHYEKAVQLMPENETFQKNLADFYWVALGDAERAMGAYVQVLKLAPRDVETLLSCAVICLSLSKQSDALDFVSAALTIEPWNEDAKQLKARIEEGPKVKEPEAADVDLYEQAQIKASNNDLDGAINDLERLHIQSPNDAKVQNDLGVLYYEAGDKDRSLSCYEQAVRLDPQDPTSCKNLADFYLMEQGRSEDALKLYHHVLEKNPEDVDALVAIGLVCSSLGQTEDAKHFYRRALEIEPWHQAAQEALDQLLPVDDRGIDQGSVGRTAAAAN